MLVASHMCEVFPSNGGSSEYVMGLCSSAEDVRQPEEDSTRTSFLGTVSVATEKELSRALDRKIVQEKKAHKEIVKLLLLGTGGSGKSTLFKQMVGLYGSGFPEKERLLYVPIIHNNVIVSMQALVNAALCGKVAVACKEEMKIFQSSQSPVFDTRLAEVLRKLWQDPEIQGAFQEGACFQLMDSTKYFLDQVEALASPSYIPTMQDVLRSRVQTRGIAEQAFNIEGVEWRMFDMGGQRSERKKWIHCFEKVTAVIFVVALSEYDLKLEEDSTQNRMVETLELFDDICNSRYFRDSSMVLFLNKRDLFAEKILRVPLTACPTFANTEVAPTYQAGCAAIERAFLAKRHDPDKLVYVHVTCATDTNNISTVFHAVRDTVIRLALRRAGVLG